MPSSTPTLSLSPIPVAPLSTAADAQRASAAPEARSLAPTTSQAPANPLHNSAWLALNHLDNIANDSPSLAGLLTALDSRLNLSQAASATHDIETKIAQALRFADDPPPLRVRTQSGQLREISLRASPTYGDAILATPPDNNTDPSGAATTTPRQFWLKQPGYATPSEVSTADRLISERGEIWLSRNTEETELHLLLENICERASVMTERRSAPASVASASSGSTPRPRFMPTSPLWLNLDQDDPLDSNPNSPLENPTALASPLANASPPQMPAAAATRNLRDSQINTIAGGRPPVLSVTTLSDAIPTTPAAIARPTAQPHLAIQPIAPPEANHQPASPLAPEPEVQNPPVRSVRTRTTTQPNSTNSQLQRQRAPTGLHTISLDQGTAPSFVYPHDSWGNLQTEKFNRAPDGMRAWLQELSKGNNKCWLRALWSNIFYQVDIAKLCDVLDSISLENLTLAHEHAQALAVINEGPTHSWKINSLEDLLTIRNELRHWLGNPTNRVLQSSCLQIDRRDKLNSQTGQTRIERILSELSWILLCPSLARHAQQDASVYDDFYHAVFNGGFGDCLHMMGICQLLGVDLVLQANEEADDGYGQIVYHPHHFSTEFARHAVALCDKIRDSRTEFTAETVGAYLHNLRVLMRKISEGLDIIPSLPRVETASLNLNEMNLLKTKIENLSTATYTIAAFAQPELLHDGIQDFNRNMRESLLKPLSMLLLHIADFQDCPLVIGCSGHFDIAFPAMEYNPLLHANSTAGSANNLAERAGSGRLEVVSA